MEPRTSVGPPFGVPEPLLLAARHLPAELLAARAAYLRVVEGLPVRYVLVEDGLLASPEVGPSGPEGTDLEEALARLADVCGGHPPATKAAVAAAAARAGPTSLSAASRPQRSVPGGVAARVEVVGLAAGPLLVADPEVEVVLHERRAETEEGRYQPEDWPGHDERPRLSLRVTSPLDLAAAVAGAEAVVAAGGPMLALAWVLGVPHAAIAPEGSAADAFVAWTGDASALLEEPKELLNATGHIFARRGRPPGLKRLEATVDQSLDEAAAALGRAVEEKAAGAPAGAGGGLGSDQELARRVHELEAVNDALRQRLAAERLRFGERSVLLEKAANTSVEAAIKAVRGQDVITRRRLEVAEKEMRRLQEETAVQQAELRAIYSTMTMRVLKPAREYYTRLRKAVR
jgi:hypothetical protein